MSATRRGVCPVCWGTFGLYTNGMVVRHWAGFFPARDDGTCQGWGLAPNDQQAQEKSV